MPCLRLRASRSSGAHLREHLRQLIVEPRGVGDRALRVAALVEDRHGGAVGLGLLERVAIDELAEDVVRALLVAHDDGRPGEADASTVRERLEQGRVERAAVRAVGFVDHDEDRLVIVEQTDVAQFLVRPELLQIAVDVLLDGGENQLGPLLGEEPLHVADALADLDRLADHHGRPRELPLEVFAVGDDDDLELPQLGHRAHLSHQEDHGEALA